MLTIQESYEKQKKWVFLMGNVIVGNHIIRMAQAEDIPFIMDFFDCYWEKGCLLSRDRAYFEYEFVVEGIVNFVIAVHRETGTVDAASGLIQCSKNIPHDAFGVMWVCKPQSGTKFLGLALNDNICNVSGVRGYTGVGVKSDTGAGVARGLYSADVYSLKHCYRLAQRSEFRIAGITKVRREEGMISSKKLMPMPTMELLRSCFDFNALPDVFIYKDAWYVEHRYFQHPYFRFNVWGIEESPGNITGFIVGRVVRCNEAACLRIVDFFGPDNALEGIGSELDMIMDAGGIEYTDFYCSGIPRETLRNAGFVIRDEEDENIIPNHFEPYEKKNIDILSIGNVIRLFKGDGDQGRPKRLRFPQEWRSEKE